MEKELARIISEIITHSPAFEDPENAGLEEIDHRGDNLTMIKFRGQWYSMKIEEVK